MHVSGILDRPSFPSLRGPVLFYGPHGPLAVPVYYGLFIPRPRKPVLFLRLARGLSLSGPYGRAVDESLRPRPFGFFTRLSFSSPDVTVLS